jgi:Uma2 family endonuclease
VAGSALNVRIGGPYGHGLDGPGGWWILYEPELHFARDVVVPDLAGWRRTRMPTLPQTASSSVAPDWICEILSPSTAAFDRERKLAVYARERVPHAWLLDPIARTLEVLRIADGRWVTVSAHAAHEVVRAEPFADIDLDLSALWPGP